jgi:hypothetical protein
MTGMHGPVMLLVVDATEGLATPIRMQHVTIWEEEG